MGWGGGIPHFCEFYLQELYQVLTVKKGRKKSLQQEEPF